MDVSPATGGDWTRALGLDAHGIAALRRTYGADARERLEDDPYVLAEPGFGGSFAAADRVAMKMELPLHDAVRIRGGLAETMRRATEQGHCLLPDEELVKRSARILGVPPQTVRQVLDAMDETRFTRVTWKDAPARAPIRLHHAEAAVAHLIRQMAAEAPPWRVRDPNEALRRANAFTGKPLTPSQATAFLGVLTSKISVITGGPGVGKTTLLKAVLHAVRSAGAKPRQGAPTGRAAMNMIDATGLDADTVHIMLGRDPDGRGFLHHRSNPLDCDLVVLDESGMSDLLLLHAVLDAMPSHAALILIGDVDQLEPVGPGRPFADLVESGAAPVYRLTEVLRQAAGSQIVTNCHLINQGLAPNLENDPGKSDFLFYRVRDPSDAKERIVDLAARGLPKLLGINATQDVQVLSPMNVRTLGTEDLQGSLRDAINPAARDTADGSGDFAIGDKVLHTRNNYRIGVRNGEIGVVTGTTTRNRTVQVNYSGRAVQYDREAMAELKLGYAVSVHKSQGSEYPAVIMPVITEHQVMLTRRLLLTACSRGRRMVVLVGQVEALARAVANDTKDARFTRLGEMLRAG